MWQASSGSRSSKPCNGDRLVTKHCLLTCKLSNTPRQNMLHPGPSNFLLYCEISAPQYHIIPSSLNSGLCSNVTSYRVHQGWPHRLKWPSCPTDILRFPWMLGKKIHILREDVGNTHTLLDTTWSDAIAFLSTREGWRKIWTRSPCIKGSVKHPPYPPQPQFLTSPVSKNQVHIANQIEFP